MNTGVGKLIRSKQGRDSRPLERDVKADIMDYLKTKFGNSGRGRFDVIHRTKFGAAGIPDILGFITVNGVAVAVAIEVKRDDKQRATENQKRYISDINAAGGIGAIVWDVEMVKKRLQIAGVEDV